MPRLLIFASGTAEGGGSGFRRLVEAARTGDLDAEIVGVVSQHLGGGVERLADELDIAFFHFPPPWDAEGYFWMKEHVRAQWCALSGWLKLTVGLDPRTTFNIHPAPLPRFGGQGMHGLHAHAAVLEAYRRGEIARTEISMHFVTERYDDGPVFFRTGVDILPSDTPETLARRVNVQEHVWQPYVTGLVLKGEIRWDGRDPASLITPKWCLPAT